MKTEKYMETMHKSDCGLHNEPAFKQTNCDCGAIEKPFVDFETEYQLDQFRQIQPQYFDQYNEKYTGTVLDGNVGKQMLSLINQMELELRKYIKFTNY